MCRVLFIVKRCFRGGIADCCKLNQYVEKTDSLYMYFRKHKSHCHLGFDCFIIGGFDCLSPNNIL